MQTTVVFRFLGMNASLVALQTHHSLTVQGTKDLMAPVIHSGSRYLVNLLVNQQNHIISLVLLLPAMLTSERVEGRGARGVLCLKQGLAMGLIHKHTKKTPSQEAKL